MNTLSSTNVEDDLPRQLSKLLDEGLSADELAELEAWLCSDPAALAQYCDFMDTEFMLAWELRCRNATTEALAGIDDERITDAKAARLHGVSSVKDRGRAAMWLLPLITLGSGLSLLGVVAVLGTTGASGQGDAAAVLSRADAALWASEPGPRKGDSVPQGPLALIEGTAQLTFHSGAVVAVHAPAEVEVLSRNRLLLRRGRITPFVPASAKGFTVVSPAGEVVDLGTEFSMSVEADGKTDVFVIDGEVDVAGGHFAESTPVRLTQGFASSLTAGNSTPRVTQRPILLDRFDSQAPLFWQVDPQADQRSFVIGGELRIPIDGHPSRKDPTVQVVLAKDLSEIVGRRSTISYKVTLPPQAGLSPHRWAGLAVDPGEGPLPWAHKAGVSAAVLVSPSWQVGVYVDGKVSAQRSVWPRQPIFPNGSDAIGPYQVVIGIDDTAVTRRRYGGATLSAMVNGVEFVRELPIRLGGRPRLALQTFTSRNEGGEGYAAIDDFSISVDVDCDVEAL